MGDKKRKFVIFTMLVLWGVFKFNKSDLITIVIGLFFLMMVEVFFFELTYHLSLLREKDNHLLMKLENPMSLCNMNVIIGLIVISVSIIAILSYETRLLYVVITMVLGLFTVLLKRNRVLILTRQFVMIHGNKYKWDDICDVMTEVNPSGKISFILVISVSRQKGLKMKTCSKKIHLSAKEWDNHFAMEVLSSYYKSRV